MTGLAFWIECKGPNTPVRPEQVRWWYRAMAAGVQVFCVRHPNDLEQVFMDVGFQSPLPGGEHRFNVSGDYRTEADVQRDVKALLDFYGFDVSDMSQGYRGGSRKNRSTRQTLGIPDLYVTRAT